MLINIQRGPLFQPTTRLLSSPYRFRLRSTRNLRTSTKTRKIGKL